MVVEQGIGHTVFVHISSGIHVNGMPFYKVLNIGIPVVSPIGPCSFPFYTTIAFKSYIPLIFSERMFAYFVHVYTWIIIIMKISLMNRQALNKIFIACIHTYCRSGDLTQRKF